MRALLLPGLRFGRFWMLCGVVITLVTLYLCLMPGDEVPDVGVSDKIQHTATFALLAFWFGSILRRQVWLWLALALLAYGGSIELAQDWMDWGRQGDILDFRADAIGVSIGLVLALTPLGRWARWLESQRPTAAT